MTGLYTSHTDKQPSWGYKTETWTLRGAKKYIQNKVNLKEPIIVYSFDSEDK